MHDTGKMPRTRGFDRETVLLRAAQEVVDQACRYSAGSVVMHGSTVERSIGMCGRSGSSMERVNPEIVIGAHLLDGKAS